MNTTPSHFRDAACAILERLAGDELELMESSHEAAAAVSGEARARFLHQAGLCQVHLFDLESKLLELGGRPISHASRPLGNRSWRASFDKLCRRYDRALGQHLPFELHELFSANSREHRGLTATPAMVEEIRVCA